MLDYLPELKELVDKIERTYGIAITLSNPQQDIYDAPGVYTFYLTGHDYERQEVHQTKLEFIPDLTGTANSERRKVLEIVQQSLIKLEELCSQKTSMKKQESNG